MISVCIPNLCHLTTWIIDILRSTESRQKQKQTSDPSGDSEIQQNSLSRVSGSYVGKRLVDTVKQEEQSGVN